MSLHKLQDLAFTSVSAEQWDSMPSAHSLKRQIALSALATCELTNSSLGIYSPPQEVREVHITNAAADQIRCMWHGHRTRGSKAPPTIPLKLFVTGYGQSAEGHTWADIEVHPGMGDWDVAA